MPSRGRTCPSHSWRNTSVIDGGAAIRPSDMAQRCISSATKLFSNAALSLVQCSEDRLGSPPRTHAELSNNFISYASLARTALAMYLCGNLKQLLVPLARSAVSAAATARALEISSVATCQATLSSSRRASLCQPVQPRTFGDQFGSLRGRFPSVQSACLGWILFGQLPLGWSLLPITASCYPHGAGSLHTTRWQCSGCWASICSLPSVVSSLEDC